MGGKLSGVQLIQSENDIRKGVRFLKRNCTYMRTAFVDVPVPPLRIRPGGFPGLARIVVGQQLSVASADAIWSRVEASVDPFEPGKLLRKRETTLRKCGLSAGKIKTLRAVAQAFDNGILSREALATSSPEDVREALCGLHGIGPWTADIYMMFCLGHADAWAPGDLALQIGVQWLTGLDERPSDKLMVEAAEAWRPWRSVAARTLWAYYAVEKARRSNVAQSESLPV